MSVEEDNSSDRGGGEAVGQQVNDEDTGGDEEGGARGVERESLVGWEVGGNFAGGPSWVGGLSLGFGEGGGDGVLLGRSGGEEEKGALGRVVEKEEGGN